MDNFLGSEPVQRFTYEYQYPYPLADLYRKVRVSRRYSDKVGYAISAAETLLKMVATVGVAVSYGEPETKDALAQFKKKSRAPTLGAWLKLFEDCIPAISRRSQLSNIGAELAQVLPPEIDRNESLVGKLDTLIKTRNEYAHGVPMTEKSARTFVDRLLPHLEQVLALSKFFMGYHFCYCEESKKIRHPDCFESVFRLCNGGNSVFPFQVLHMDEAVDPYAPYLVSLEYSEAVSLYPVMSIREYLEQEITQFAFFEKRDPSILWKSYEIVDETLWAGTEFEDEDLLNWMNSSAELPVQQLSFSERNRPAWSLDATKYKPSLDSLQILGQIGSGRYARVLLAYHTGLKEERVVKVLRQELLSDPTIRKRFELEAQISAKLVKHDACPIVYDYGISDDGLAYIVTEAVKDGSLEEHINTWGKFSTPDCVGVALQLFSKLAKVHSEGILHRDLKLSNILASGDRYLFCDFGSSLLLDREARLTLDGATFGTLGYVAPESSKDGYTVRSDIYSLGVCVIHLLAGHLPDEPRKWLFDEFKGDLEARNLFLSLIETLPENRPASASAVLHRLQEIKDSADKFDKKVPSRAISSEAAQATRRKKRRPPRRVISKDGTAFCLIRAGEFVMGGAKYPNERPMHRVRISDDFFLAETPVTNRQFMRFIADTGYGSTHRKFLMHTGDQFDEKWKLADCPVVCVSWEDANQYIMWKSEKDNQSYFLPTEAQWEYACRAGTQSVYYWGNEYSTGKANANALRDSPIPVGSYPANQLGLYDMLGNVWEWCEDIMDVGPREESLYYRHCSEIDGGVAVDPVNDIEAFFVSERVSPTARVGKGGSFFSKPHNCRPANRRGQEGSEPIRSFGFRLAMRVKADREINRRRKIDD